MKAAIAALLFLLACKEESKPSTPAAAEKPTPTERAHKPNRPPPTLNADDDFDPGADDGRERPRLPGGPEDREPRDYTDPAVREEMRAMREERRKQREAMLDTNKDGVVSPEERQQRMAPMHKRLDQNGDGKLTPDEIASSERRMGFDDPAALDTDRNGEVSLAELDAAVQQRRDKMRERWRGRNGRGSAGVPPE